MQPRFLCDPCHRNRLAPWLLDKRKRFCRRSACLVRDRISRMIESCSVRGAPMPDVTHRFVETNGIRMHLAEQGSGPVVLLCHGFPESWYSWRHQIDALAV